MKCPWVKNILEWNSIITQLSMSVAWGKENGPGEENLGNSMVNAETDLASPPGLTWNQIAELGLSYLYTATITAFTRVQEGAQH